MQQFLPSYLVSSHSKAYFIALKTVVVDEDVTAEREEGGWNMFARLHKWMIAVDELSEDLVIGARTMFSLPT